MLTVSGPYGIRPGMPGRVPRLEGGGFTVPAAEVPATPVAVRLPATVAVGSSLVLALQEQRGRDDADDEARRHGGRLLDALAELQRALLSGGDGDGLARLSELATVGLEGADPALARVLSSIRLRARIELERRTLRLDGSQANEPGAAV